MKKIILLFSIFAFLLLFVTSVSGAIENFTTYTEVDGQNCLTVTTNQIDISFMTKSTTDSYVYYDKGANHFSDFSHLLSIKQTSSDTAGYCAVWGVGDTVDDYWNWNDGLTVYINTRPATVTRIVLRVVSGGVQGSYDYYDTAYNTEYFLTVNRSGTDLTCDIFSDFARTTRLDRLVLACANTLFRYVYGVSSLALDGVEPFSGFVADLDLQEDLPWENSAPVNSNPFPVNNSVNVSISLSQLNITVNDLDGANQSMNITWRTNASGEWKTMQTNNTVSNGTYYNLNMTEFDEYDTKYFWSINTSDNYTTPLWDNDTYCFTTEPTPSIYLIKGLEKLNKNITWEGLKNTSVWANATGGSGGTMEVNMTVNQYENVSEIRLNLSHLNITKEIYNTNIYLQVSSDNISWGVNVTQYYNNFSIRKNVWSEINGFYGTNPFLGSGITDKNTSIFIRFKLYIPNSVSNETYNQSDWKIYLGYDTKSWYDVGTVENLAKDITKNYHAHCIIQCANGDLYVSHYNSSSHSDGGDVSSHRSTDNGVTWNSDSEIWNIGSENVPYGVVGTSLGLSSNGTIVCLLQTRTAYAKTNYYGLRVKVSYDNATTWIDKGWMNTTNPNASRHITSSIVTVGNIMYAPTYTDTPQNILNIYKSLDNGTSWKNISQIYSTATTCGYATLIQMANGSFLWMDMYNNRNDYSISEDNCVTWTTVKDSGTTIRDPDLNSLGDNYFLHGRDKDSSNNFRFWYSTNGIQWTNATVVDGGGAENHDHYSSGQVVNNDLILTFSHLFSDPKCELKTYWLYNIINMTNYDVLDFGGKLTVLSVSPEFDDSTSSSAYTGDNFVFNVNVTVSGTIYGVWVDYYYNAGGHTNASMNHISNDWYNYSIVIPSNSLDTLNYSFSANSTNNNWNKTSIAEVIVYDNDNPVVSNIQADPSSFEPDSYTNITCDVTDNIALVTIMINITYPDTYTTNVSMTFYSGDSYYNYSNYTQLGVYDYFIWCNDSSDNSYNSSVYHFTVGYEDEEIIISNEYPTNNSVNVCPHCLPISIIIGYSNNINLTFFYKEKETSFTEWCNFTNVSDGNYSFCASNMKFNTTYEWFVNVSSFSNSSYYNTSDTFSFNTTSDINCVNTNVESLIQEYFLLGLLFSLIALVFAIRKKRGN